MTEDKFARDELERRLKEALELAYNEAVMDEEISVNTDGFFPVITQYSLTTNEPIAQFEIRFDIKEIAE